MKIFSIFYMGILFSSIISSIFCNVTQKPLFVLFVYSYNSSSLVQKNFESIAHQTYSNYRIIYVDDCSSDGTANVAQNYLKKYKLEDKVALLKNPEQYGMLKSLYNAVHELCSDNEILIPLDGSARLAHENVLKELSLIYSNQNIWMTYGQYADIDGKPGLVKLIPPDIIKKRMFRKWQWNRSGLVTFYGWLFKLIYLEDLLVDQACSQEGRFYPVTYDLAMILPMLEMAHTHIRFVAKPACIRHVVHTPQDTQLEECLYQEHVAKPVLYKPLQKPITSDLAQHEDACVDIIIFSSEHHENIEKLLHSVKKNISNIRKIAVFCDCSSPGLLAPYRKLQQIYKEITFVNIWKRNSEKVYKFIQDFAGEHILFFSDAIIIDQPIQSADHVKMLEKTRAQGIFYALSPKVVREKDISFEHIIDDIYAWKFSCDYIQEIIHAYEISALYRKEDFLKELVRVKAEGILGLESVCRELMLYRCRIGLFYSMPKVHQIC